MLLKQVLEVFEILDSPRADGEQAVSYTHLDVYKRQVYRVCSGQYHKVEEG